MKTKPGFLPLITAIVIFGTSVVALGVFQRIGIFKLPTLQSGNNGFESLLNTDNTFSKTETVDSGLPLSSSTPSTVKQSIQESPAAKVFTLNSLEPNAGKVGSRLTINGSGFGGREGSVLFALNGEIVSAAQIKTWSESQIITSVPLLSGGLHKVAVYTKDEKKSNELDFVVEVVKPYQPRISSIVSIDAKSQGSWIFTIKGSGFGNVIGKINFNDYYTRDFVTSCNPIPVAWLDSEISCGTILIDANKWYRIEVVGGGGSASAYKDVYLVSSYPDFKTYY